MHIQYFKWNDSFLTSLSNWTWSLELPYTGEIVTLKLLSWTQIDLANTPFIFSPLWSLFWRKSLPYILFHMQPKFLKVDITTPKAIKKLYWILHMNMNIKAIHINHSYYMGFVVGIGNVQRYLHIIANNSEAGTL